MTEGTQARPERVMVLEPDAERRQMLAQTLMQSGFRCFMADSVHDALPFYQDRQDSACMLTILNARLPWCESVELLSRAQENDWPVLFLTAEAANVAHLQSLFDLPCDALVHPFSPKQLMNAVENLLLLSQSLLRAGPLRLDTLHHRVTMAGEHLTLTAQEFALLEVLVKTPGAAVSRETLLRTAWGYQDLGETNRASKRFIKQDISSKWRNIASPSAQRGGFFVSKIIIHMKKNRSLVRRERLVLA